MKEGAKVILITGATSGFGKATAHYLAGIGHKVYGFGRSVEAPSKEAGGNLTMMRMDVNDSNSVSEGVNAVISAEGRIDVLLCAAGVGLVGAVEDVSIAEAKALFETNLFGSLRVCKAVLPQMRAQKSGLIMLVSSVAGIFGVPFQGLYSASKFAVEAIVDSMSMEVRQFGIDVVALEPGDFNTGFNANKMKAAASEDEGSPYRKAYLKAMKNVDKDENTGYTADFFAAAVARIIKSRHRRIRYVIGSPLEKAGILLKRVLPQRAFEKLLYAYYMLSR